MKPLVQTMKALSDPGRIKIIKLLQHRSLCVCEIQSAIGLAQPTVSRHLKVLEDAGLVDRTKDGLWVNYHLAQNPGSPYAAALLEHLRHWLDEEPEVAELVRRLPEIRRETICSKTPGSGA